MGGVTAAFVPSAPGTAALSVRAGSLTCGGSHARLARARSPVVVRTRAGGAIVCASSTPLPSWNGNGSTVNGLANSAKHHNGAIPAWSIRQLVRTEWRHLLLAAVSLFVATGAALSFPLAFGAVLRTIFDLKTGEHRRLLLAVGRACILYALEPIATLVWLRSTCTLIDNSLRLLKRRIFHRLLHEDVAFFDRTPSSELAAMVTRDVTEVRDVLWGNLGRDRGLRSLLEVIGGLLVVFSLVPQLAMVFLFIVPAVSLVVAELGKRLGRTVKAEAQQNVALQSQAAEIFQAIKTVKSFGAEDREQRRFDGTLGAISATSRRFARLKSLVEAANRVAIYATIVAVTYTGGLLVLAGKMKATMLVSFTGYIFSLNFAVQGLSYSYSDYWRAKGVLSRVVDYMNRPTTAAARGGGGLRPSRVGGTVRFEDVSFEYSSRPDVAVLRALNLSLERGNVTALVGPSGAGKSTIVALLSRFYQPSSGRVTLDGTDIEDFDVGWYARQVALVGQEPVLFTGTVRENIAYALDREVSDAEVERAARLANAHDFIGALPQGYNTYLGERGSALSGGQRQRVAIARAVLKDAPILVLDEATSALDVESEKLVQQALERLMSGRTALVIAHRLSTVVSADRICVLRDGRVVEQGSHAEMIQKTGDSTYKRLMRTQTSAFMSSTDDGK